MQQYTHIHSFPLQTNENLVTARSPSHRVPSPFCLIPSVTLKISASRDDIFALPSTEQLGNTAHSQHCIKSEANMDMGNKYPRSYRRDLDSPWTEKTSWSDFQRAVFLWAQLPWKKREVGRGTHVSWEMKGEPHGHNLKSEQRTRGRREETCKI